MSKATFTIPCEQCGTHFQPHYKKRRLSRFCTSECYSLSQSIPSGTKYERLTSLGLTELTTNTGRRLTRFMCDCGKTVLVTSKSVRLGFVKSCGCLRIETATATAKARITHGASQTPEYVAYSHARKRCISPKDPAWVNYGGRGIEFRFNSFEEWLDELGEKPSPELTVDRINNNGHYERGNVQWATRQQQVHNRRPIRPGLTRKKRKQAT